MNKSQATAMADPAATRRLTARLAAAAGQVSATWSAHLAAMELRDVLVVEAYKGGWKVREISAAAKISPSRVHAIVAKC